MILFCSVLTLTMGFDPNIKRFDFCIAASIPACTLLVPAAVFAVIGIVNASKALTRGVRAGKKTLVWGIVVIIAAQTACWGSAL